MNVKIMALVTSLLALGTIKADSSKLPILNPHRVNFGLLEFDYDYLKRDDIYGGITGSMHTIYRTKDKSQNLNNYSTNIEGRIGYNIPILNDHYCLGYAGVGYTHFNMENTNFLKDWTYLTAAFKPIFRTGPTFSVGVHAKGYYTLYQTSTALQINETPDSPLFGEEEVIVVKNGEKRFGYELSIPLIWNLGEGKVWEIQLEPYFFKMPDLDRTHLLGSRLTFGYRF